MYNLECGIKNWVYRLALSKIANRKLSFIFVKLIYKPNSIKADSEPNNFKSPTSTFNPVALVGTS